MFKCTLLSSSALAVVLVKENYEPDINELLVDEQRLIPDSWSTLRRKTFILGRIAAHQALRMLKSERIPVLRGNRGEPVWPKNITGSISHKDNIAVAVAGRTDKYKGIGIDIEDSTIELSEKEYSLFCTEHEIKCIHEGKISPISIFSQKESLLKAWHAAYNEVFEWKEMEVDLFLKLRQHVDIQHYANKQFVVNLCIIRNKK